MCCYHAFCLVVLVSHAFYFFIIFRGFINIWFICSCTQFSMCSFFNKHFPLKWISMCTISASLLLPIHWLNFKIRILSALVASRDLSLMERFFEAFLWCGSIIVESKILLGIFKDKHAYCCDYVAAQVPGLFYYTEIFHRYPSVALCIVWL